MRFPWDKEQQEVVETMKVLDLTQGFGDFKTHKLSKFPDNSIKFELKGDIEIRIGSLNVIAVETTLRTNDDLIVLALVKEVIDYRYTNVSTYLKINYMMYQQDDRKFGDMESFGLKVISNFINSMNWNRVEIFHPHSDKVEMINNCKILSNIEFIDHSISSILTDSKDDNPLWVIPDAGAFKTQFKQAQNLEFDFITCMKSRNHIDGAIETIVNCDDLQGRNCFIMDDICLGGRTFIQIAEKLKEKNCGKLYLIVSHGIFNHGVDNLLTHFEKIYTTNSICTIKHEKLLTFLI